jgi:hypothetical protein
MNLKQIDQFYADLKQNKAHYLGYVMYEGQRIAQWHHPIRMIEDIHGENQTKQFTSIQIIGSPGTGKTTLATFIAHEIHSRDPSYLVYHFGKKEILNFDTVLDSLPNRNVILVFDDVSLVFKLIKDQDRKTKVLQTLTEARHPKFESSDRKVIVIANTHYSNALEKLWRSQGNWKMYTDLNNEEQGNFNAITKGYYKSKVANFSSITLEQFRKKEFTVSLTSTRTKTYETNKPFRFIMAYDNSKLRFFLIPAKSCNLCSRDKRMTKKTEATPDEIIKLAEKYYDKHGIAGLKLALLAAGRTEQYQNQLVYAYNTSKEILSAFDIDLEKLALRMRERAQIRGSRLYTIRKKKTDFAADLEKIRHSQNVEPITDEVEPNDASNSMDLT